MANGSQQVPVAERNKFGTFAGVFTPSILTILGVIMFLRAGYVVGQAGIGGALWILLLAESIVLVTAVSMAAIATNTKISGGGAYFLISRVLGAQFGGAIGLALYLAQALSVPFYTLGFTEALVQSFPALKPFFPYLAGGTACALFVLNYIGAAWAIKAQYFVMTVLGLAIVSFLGGAAVRFSPELMSTNWTPGYTSPTISFWVVFAIYFPAVTGILAGINMSGDLRDPGRSLMRGTFAAIAVGFVIYLAEILLCGGSQERVDLVTRPYRMLIDHALMGSAFLVIGGVFAATLSSALGSFLGAPRVLQALARDRVVPGISWFARGTAKGDEPRHALWLTLAITVVVIFLAARSESLKAFDAVAAVVTMFFLCTYGMVNLAAFVESFGANPSFRPRFRFFHWTVSLVGAIECLVIMFLIDAGAAVVSALVIAGLYLVISRRMHRSAFGDARRGFLYSVVARNLQRLRVSGPDPKNWRPTLLVLSGNPMTRAALLRFGAWFGAGRGIVTAVQIVIGCIEEMEHLRKTALSALEKVIQEGGWDAFPEVLITSDIDEGIRTMVQAHSIGPIKPNAVLIGWPSDPQRVAPWARHLRDIRSLGRSVISVIDRGTRIPNGGRGRIDVWWRGKENGSLMMILAYLLTCNWEWSNAAIRILRLVEDEPSRVPSQEALSALAAAARIDAEIIIVVSKEPFEVVLSRYSRESDVVFLGFQPPEEDRAASFAHFCEQTLKDMPTTILVSSSGEADLLA